MKTKITALLNTPIETASWLLKYSEEIKNLFPEIKEVHYEKGSEEDFDKGTIISVRQVFRSKEWLSKVEILEYRQGEFITQQISDSRTSANIRTTLSRRGEKTLLTSDGEIKLNSLLMRVLSPIVARRLKGLYTERYQRLVKYFDPKSSNESVHVRISIAGLPFWLMYALFVAGCLGVGALIGVAIKAWF